MKERRRQPSRPERKPNIVWMEGLLDVFNAPFPHEDGDPRRAGFNVGKQIVGLYIVEMLLKYALDNAGINHDENHDLHGLFNKLSRPRQRAVERTYTRILHSEADSAWDIAKTADSLLRYLGKNAITDTRYFWESGRTHVATHASILFAPNMLRPLIYALFIVLHNYPSKPIVERYDTTFQSLAESFEEN